MPLAHDAVHRLTVRARDPQTASTVIAGFYGTHQMDTGRPAEDFELRVTQATAGGLGSIVLRLSFENRFHAAPPADFTAITVHRGSSTYAPATGPAHQLGPGDVFRPSLRDPLRSDLTPDGVAAALTLPLDAITDAAATADSTADTGPGVDFLDHRPVDDHLRAYWVGLASHAHQQLMDPAGPLDSPVARQHLVATLARAALLTFPNTTMTTDHLPGPGHVGAATVRRAIAHMHLHAHGALTLSDLASAAGVGPRALQHAFRRHLGHSPMHHLRQIRLGRAHHELLAADPAAGDTVTVIAQRWGFTNPSRFAAAHRSTYGTTPAQALRT